MRGGATLWLGVGIWLAAQPMPDTVWGFSGSDTLTLVVHQPFSQGWTTRLWLRLPPWQEVQRETLTLDPQGRLQLWAIYCRPPFEETCRRIDFVYAGARVYHTDYGYRAPVFVPERRTYVWGGLLTLDQLLAGAFGDVGWPSAPDTLHPIWPFPRFWLRAMWPDSLLTEAFDPIFQVFVEARGYKFFTSAGTCNSDSLYEGPYIYAVAKGYRERCFDAAGQLVFSKDSLCDTVNCLLTYRQVDYSNGRPSRDTLSFTLIKRSDSQVIGQSRFVTEYDHDPSGRLIEVRASRRRYKLTHSGRSLSLLSAPLPAFTLRYSSTERWIQAENLQEEALVTLYALTGQLLWQSSLYDSQPHPLPPLEAGCYLLRVQTRHQGFQQKLISLLAPP